MDRQFLDAKTQDMRHKTKQVLLENYHLMFLLTHFTYYRLSFFY